MRKPNLSNIKQAKVLVPAKDLATLEAELAEQEDHLEDTVLRLSDYLSAVEMVIKQTFDHRVWVKAEIRNLSSKGGHYYFELAEKDGDGKVVASCRGNLWRFKAARVLAKFERATGMPLERDLTVLLKVSAGFHAQYGFSITIEDIDPSYTLGDLARQYAEMVDRLTGEGLLHLNQQLPAPFDIEHVLVIAPEKAAGLGDFQADADRLASTGACQFHYHNSTFQGNHAPAEIRQAIVSAQQQFYDTYQRLPDLLVIIRGGGAVGDLAYLNDYELAALVAEQLFLSGWHRS
ncbi:exodeoxyribonuclease VII large subunit [Psychrobacter sp. JCM 18901]|uniref:exodeoxyribonuclease VII large subunit n=1 Tax=Psychrobacter sp. JCM 18901 TaxID=1298609 RepID=UPI0004B99B55|nr:exodeoxyribonuclease VII large subunit [Psychrobacter sp. JCM 18901]